MYTKERLDIPIRRNNPASGRYTLLCEALSVGYFVAEWLDGQDIVFLAGDEILLEDEWQEKYAKVTK
jgi:hypothetical protein